MRVHAKYMNSVLILLIESKNLSTADIVEPKMECNQFMITFRKIIVKQRFYFQGFYFPILKENSYRKKN